MSHNPAPFQLVRVQMTYREDEKDSFQIMVPVDQDGRICVDEFYGHFIDEGEMYPVLIAEDGEGDTVLRYLVDWGWGEKSCTHIEILSRPLAINQEVWREDVSSNGRDRYCYEIRSITPLL
ncbi:hypothetical protein VRRI112168_02505 [Vreelandella rituensis]|uniref:Uncharacterized protein n=1 Tax=Vreelandella rituensis TaxID=2282306 RepID=A0A368U9J1_9GAMM|nr:hypothetical protein [Halomonas rituensis]RCV93615.1 hypothetical protein DU506_00225 [Halomonas rituensis]